MADISSLFKWYLENQANLVEKYNGKYLLITKEGVQEAFDDEDKAYFEGENKFGLGNFLVKLCTPGNGAYTINVYSPAIQY